MRSFATALGLVLVLLTASSPGITDEPLPATQGHAPDEMRDANRAAALLLAERLKRDRPGDYELLRCVRPRDLLVVRGAYDHVEWVLRQVGVSFTECRPSALATTSLRGVEVVLVNCPGKVGRRGALALRRFVRGGGLLFTTDWAVLHVIEPAFPNTIRYTRNPTRDDVVSIRVVKPEHLFLKHVLTGNDPHLWWLESQSYPIRVIDRRRVEVLIDSWEMRRKYGAGPIAVTFRAGRGRVVHIVSHFYLQRSELRNRRDRLPAGTFAAEVGFAPGSPVAKRLETDGLGRVRAGELRSAYSAQQFLANLLIEAKRARPPRPAPRPEPRHAEPSPDPTSERGTLLAEATLLAGPGGRPVKTLSAGLRLRVLERRDGWVQVRTAAGTTGWLRANAVGE